MLLGVGLGLGIAVAFVGAVSDLRTGHIPNWLTLGALAAAPPVTFALEASAHGTRAGLVAAGLSLVGAIVCGLPPLFAFLKGSMGGGDVKLLAALGALLGPRLGLDAEFYAFVLGAIYVPGRLAWEGKLLASLVSLGRSAWGRFRPKAERTAAPATDRMQIRLGPAICGGTIVAAALASLAIGA
jgi:prepilin peptidase CpaA